MRLEEPVYMICDRDVSSERPLHGSSKLVDGKSRRSRVPNHVHASFFKLVAATLLAGFVV